MNKFTMFVITLTILACGIVTVPIAPPATNTHVSPTASPLWCVTAPPPGNVRLRTGPSTAYAELLLLRDGERVELVQDHGDGWSRVRAWRREVVDFDGYMRNIYLEVC